VSERIWVVVSTADFPRYREPRIKELLKTGVDMLYPRRLSEARRKLRIGDRVVIHFGGRAGTHPHAQHLVAAGRIAEVARRLTRSDTLQFPKMLDLTKQAFTKWDDASVNGIVRFDILDYTARDVTPLPRTLPDGTGLYRPRPGDNFIGLQPNTRAHQVVNNWWLTVFG
jgi:hypothetical protein